MNKPSSNPLKLESQLRSQANGIKKYKDLWPPANAPTVDDVKSIAQMVHRLQADVKRIESELTKVISVRDKYIRDTAKPMYIKVRDQAYSTHGRSSSKITEYGLNSTGTPSKKPIIMNNDLIIEQHKDRPAHIIKWNKITNAKSYEIWFATQNSNSININQDKLKLLDITKSLFYTHVGIAKGIKYFYALRAFNSNGYSEFSKIKSIFAK